MARLACGSEEGIFSSPTQFLPLQRASEPRAVLGWIMSHLRCWNVNGVDRFVGYPMRTEIP